MRWVALACVCFCLTVVSCGDEAPRQTVPFASVYFRVDPRGYDPELRTPHSYKIFTERERRLPSDRFGYGGVLVVSDATGVLHAFDLCCPNEDNRKIVVDPEYGEHGGYSGTVKCASCGSVFVTMFGLGSVDSGPSDEPLQRYNVIPMQDGAYQVVN